VRRHLLDLILCPACRGPFELEVFSTAMAGAADVLVEEVVDGALWCTRCAGAYPVISGVPRLLRAPLLGHMRVRYPTFFAAHPELRCVLRWRIRVSSGTLLPTLTQG
jgi:uncharacterized protein YbaR (Trm112 family)